MNLLFRRTLYIFFIIIFLILAPLLVMYATGYRYNFGEWKVVKTGILILESKPEKVNVYINDKLEHTKTPIDGQDLIPGLYGITVSRKGYYPWQKKLEIKSNLTTFAQDIILFKKTEPIKIIDGDFADFTLSPDSKKIITLWQDQATAEIWEYDLGQQNSSLLLRNSLDDSRIEIKKWSANGQNLVFNNRRSPPFDRLRAGLRRDFSGEVGNNYFIIKFKENFWSNDENEILQLSKLVKQPIINLKWDNSNDDIIYASTGNSLFRVNIASQEIKNISFDQLSDFIVYDKILYYNTKLSCLIEIKKNPNIAQQAETNNCIYRLSKDNDYQLISSPRGLITLRSPASKNLLVIDLNNKTKIFQAKAEEVKWNNVSNKMLYYDDIEIGTFSPSHQEPYKNEIIGRYGQRIENVLWYPSHHHLIVLFSDHVKIVELDVRDKRNVIDLSDFSDLKNVYLDEEGENVYVSGRRGGEEGIFQVNIF